jgi:3-deoxy-D-manno-octulosonate 8-phosphate phosphatase (KDO 8-P phosphatase)
MKAPDDAVLRGIRLLFTDVDGVLTDGRIHLTAGGEEHKVFHVHDAAGIVYWHRAGGLSGFLSGRGGSIVERHARDLGVHEVHLGKHHKWPIVEDVLARRELRAEQVAYVGDDLLDLEVLRRVGFAVSVPGGRAEVRAHAHYVTRTPGGSGALREVVELLLRARGAWDAVLAKGGLP